MAGGAVADARAQREQEGEEQGEEEEDGGPPADCGVLDFDELDAAEERAAGSQPWFRRRLRDVPLGCEVKILPDASAVLSACRAESIPTDHDKLRIASLGLLARVLQKDPGDNTLLCSVPSVGDVWFPLPAVTWAREDGDLADSAGAGPLHVVGSPAVGCVAEGQQVRVRRFHTVGDSHSANGWPSNVCIHFVGSLLCYNIARLDLRSLDPPVEEGDAVCFCFGEIDCRCHVHKHCQNGRTYQEVIDGIIERYFSFLVAKSAELPPSVRIVVYNVLPPVKMKNMQHNSDRPMHPFIVPFAGTDQERMSYASYFNSCLEAECSLRGFTFLDVREVYALEDGFLDPDLSDSSIHIGDGRLLEEFLARRFLISRGPPLSAQLASS